MITAGKSSLLTAFPIYTAKVLCANDETDVVFSFVAGATLRAAAMTVSHPLLFVSYPETLSIPIAVPLADSDVIGNCYMRGADENCNLPVGNLVKCDNFYDMSD